MALCAYPPTTDGLRDPAHDEQCLVERMRTGDRHAFDEFFDRYAPRVGAFAARRAALDAASLEDVVQTTMIRAMQGLRGYRGGASLFSWLCQICRNHLADLRRKAARQPGIQSLEQLQAAKPSETLAELTDFRDPLDECAADATRGAVRCAINRLSAMHAEILELHYGDDLPVPQVARLLRLSESAAESRLVRARKAFRELWSRESHMASI
jgi:RNA polymerase sigma-70 factor (ECF subfamily)